jgi:hypothetical protein
MVRPADVTGLFAPHSVMPAQPRPRPMAPPVEDYTEVRSEADWIGPQADLPAEVMA